MWVGGSNRPLRECAIFGLSQEIQQEEPTIDMDVTYALVKWVSTLTLHNLNCSVYKHHMGFP